MRSIIIPHIRRVWIIDNNHKYEKIGSGEWIVFNNDKVFPSLLKHYFLSDQFHLKFMNTVSGVGGSLKRARPKLIGEFDLLLPPINEQKKLSELLDKVENIITVRQKTLIQIQRLKQSILEKILSNKDNIIEEKKLGDTCDVRDEL